MLLPLNPTIDLLEEFLVEKALVDLLGLGVGNVGLEVERRLDGADDAGLLVLRIPDFLHGRSSFVMGSGAFVMGCMG